jgi:hypothetical protein
MIKSSVSDARLWGSGTRTSCPPEREARTHSEHNRWAERAAHAGGQDVRAPGIFEDRGVSTGAALPGRASDTLFWMGQLTRHPNLV